MLNLVIKRVSIVHLTWHKTGYRLLLSTFFTHHFLYNFSLLTLRDIVCNKFILPITEKKEEKTKMMHCLRTVVQIKVMYFILLHPDLLRTILKYNWIIKISFEQKIKCLR